MGNNRFAVMVPASELRRSVARARLAAPGKPILIGPPRNYRKRERSTGVAKPCSTIGSTGRAGEERTLSSLPGWYYCVDDDGKACASKS